jgi:hypothetical protein
VKFRITPHSGFKASARPADAIDLLWQRLETSRGETSFTKVGAEIRATWGVDVPASMERDERDELGRRAVLDIVIGVCEQAPELNSDWFAVSARR